MLKRDKNKTIKHGINIKVNRFISMLERASGLLKLVTCTALLYPQKVYPLVFAITSSNFDITNFILRYECIGLTPLFLDNPSKLVPQR